MTMRGFLDEHTGSELKRLGDGAAAGLADEIGVDDRRRVGSVAGAAVRASGGNHKRVEQGLGKCGGGTEQDEWGDG